MSKKRFESAITYYRTGNEEEAVRKLRAMDSGYVEKRVRNLVSIAEITPSDAAALWSRAFPHLAPLNIHDVTIRSLAPSPQKDEDIWDPIVAPSSGTLLLDDPSASLDWLGRTDKRTVVVDSFHLMEPWGLVALAALGRTDGDPRLRIRLNGSSAYGRFAHALGLLDVLDGKEPHGVAETGRTVKLKRIGSYGAIEPIARQISYLLLARPNEAGEDDEYYDREEVRLTVYYVLVELMRNVVQHSEDSLGGIVVAQSMSRPTERWDSSNPGRGRRLWRRNSHNPPSDAHRDNISCDGAGACSLALRLGDIRLHKPRDVAKRRSGPVLRIGNGKVGGRKATRIVTRWVAIPTGQRGWTAGSNGCSQSGVSRHTCRVRITKAGYCRLRFVDPDNYSSRTRTSEAPRESDMDQIWSRA